MSERSLRIIKIAGILAFLAGLLFTPAAVCGLVFLFPEMGSPYFQHNELVFPIMILSVWGILFFGGLLVVRQTRAGLKMKALSPARLPPWVVAAWSLLLALAVGIVSFNSSLAALVLPFAAILAAILAPLAAVMWSLNSPPVPSPETIPVVPAHPAQDPAADPVNDPMPDPPPAATVEAEKDSGRPGKTPEPYTGPVIQVAGPPTITTLSSLHFTVAVLSGGTLAVLLAAFLEAVLPLLALALVEGLYPILQEAWRDIINTLANPQVGKALSSYGFILSLVQLAVIAPLVEELVKPLFVVPLVRSASTARRAFWLGAAAGLGFAAVENIIYFTAGIEYWRGIAPLRSIGAAIHPLGAGLVALGWYEVFHPPEHAAPGWSRRRAWLLRYGLAVGLHALWNGGSLVLGVLARAEFFGSAPAQVEVGGLTLAGVILALLMVLGAAAWMGLRHPWAWPAVDETQPSQPSAPGLGSQQERALAVWGIACLLAVLPLGLAALRLLGGQ